MHAVEKEVDEHKESKGAAPAEEAGGFVELTRPTAALMDDIVGLRARLAALEEKEEVQADQQRRLTSIGLDPLRRPPGYPPAVVHQIAPTRLHALPPIRPGVVGAG